jgi:tRNA threonylcarbamoyladenosine biosynthesis protein TsaB
VIALDTLMAVAEDARQHAPASLFPAGQILWVLQDARMDELYASAFQWDGRQWRVHEPARLWPLSEPAQRWLADDGALDASLRWAGNAGAAYPASMHGILSAEVSQTSATAHAPLPGAAPVPADAPTSGSAVPRGAALAALARAAWARGDTLDAALALPRYVRDKVAQTTAERAAQRVADKPART